jgi:hypothetical protein
MSSLGLSVRTGAQHVPDLHLVMHAVAIKKHAAPAAIASVAGLPAARVTAALAIGVTKGRLVEADGRYVLTPAGRLMLDGEYSRYCGALRADARFSSGYERFEVINRDLKQLITDWQTVDIGGKRVPNDHSNKEHDARILDRLGDLHERFEPILQGLVACAPRLAVYQQKLEAALEKAEDGDHAWVSDARTESYHTVWFELHEDLLRLLGRVRDE